MLRRWSSAGGSHVGRVRSGNEDKLGYHIDVYELYIVCDGVGGASAGEVASQLAMQAVKEFVKRYVDDPDRDLTLVNAITYANDLIRAERDRVPEQGDMATTIVALLCDQDVAYIAHAGDSRAYRLRNGHLERLTVDHSDRQQALEMIQRLNGLGLPIPLMIQTLRHSPGLTCALGFKDHVHVALRTELIQSGDIFLLCSDGLCGEYLGTWPVPDARIQELLLCYPDPAEVVVALVREALLQGGHDNVTVIVVRFD